MFGYVRPLLDLLSDEERRQYKSAYCGLCHTLARDFGPLARYTVSYDMTFLYMLLQSDDGYPALRLCRCPAHPLRRRCAACQTDGSSLAAAATVLFFCCKLRDDLQDEVFLKKLAARFLLLMFAVPFHRARKRFPELSEVLCRTGLRRAHGKEPGKRPLTVPCKAR